MSSGISDRVKRFTPEVRSLILLYKRQGHNCSSISKLLLRKHFLKCSRQGIRKFIGRNARTGNTYHTRRPGRDSLRKVKNGHKEFLNLWITQNSEITANELCGSYLNALSILETFKDVVFVDETTVEMSSSGRISFYRPYSSLECLPSKAPKPKHAYKVHMWAGISYMGRTYCCLFTGIMDSAIYQQILERNFLPFIKETHPNGFRLYQDNDSKHCSKSTKEWLEKKNIEHCVMKTPASSPDLNPIENVWSSLKDFLQRHVKPKKKEELVSGIAQFWKGLTAEQCGRYIDHVHKVIPEVCLNRGGPTKY